MNHLQPLHWIGLFLLVSWVWFSLRLAWFTSLAPAGERLAWFNDQVMGVLVWAVFSLGLSGALTGVAAGLSWALVPGLAWFWSWLLHSALVLTALMWLSKLGLRIIHLGPKRLPGESARDYEQRGREWLLARRMRLDAGVRKRAQALRQASQEDDEEDEGAPLSPAERLRQLKALRAEGLIDEAEFQERRQAIVNSL